MLCANLVTTFKHYQNVKIIRIICWYTFPYLIEGKRYKAGNTFSDAWWQQVETAAENMNKEPVLVYKFDRQPITVVMRLEHLMKDGALHEEKVKMDWEAFCYVARENWNS